MSNFIACRWDCHSLEFLSGYQKSSAEITENFTKLDLLQIYKLFIWNQNVSSRLCRDFKGSWDRFSTSSIFSRQKTIDFYVSSHLMSKHLHKSIWKNSWFFEWQDEVEITVWLTVTHWQWARKALENEPPSI